MLYSTKKIIPQISLNYLSNVPEEENKEQCERDIHRTTVNFGSQKDITGQQEQQIPFEDAQAKIANTAKKQWPDMNEHDISYLSHLALNLCHQNFFISPTFILQHNRFFISEIAAALKTKGKINNEQNLSDRTIDLQRDHLKLIWKPWFVYGTESDPKVVQRTITWTFFPDKTMQISMDNPIDGHEDVCKDYFKALVTREALRELVRVENIGRQEQLDINDPFNALIMDCNWEKCEIFSKLVEPNADLSQMDHQSISQKVEKIYQIENLSKANPYTVARLISTYMKKNPNVELKSEDSIYNMLSEEAKGNLEKIAQELNKRLDNEGISVKIHDVIDIVVNFLLKLANYFNMKIGQSYLSKRNFNGFCENFKVESNESNHKTFQEFCRDFRSNFIFLPQNQV